MAQTSLPSAEPSSNKPREYSLERAKYFGWSSVTGSLDEDRLKQLQTYLRGKKVLDAGCGGGAYTQYLYRHGYDAYGVDSHEELLLLAQEQHPGPTYVRADLATQLPFPDKYFDSAFCYDVLEHVNDRAALSELVRVSRQTILFTVPRNDDRRNRWRLTFGTYLDPTHLRYYSHEDIRFLTQSVGINSACVYPEGRVPLELMVRYEFNAQSRFRLLTPIYQRLFQFIGPRLRGPDWYVNWLVVVELEGNTRY